MKRTVFFFGLIMIIAMSLISITRATRQRYHLQSTTGGLGRMSNDKYVVDSTLFQVAPGYSRNDKYQLQAGFWMPSLPTPSAVPSAASPTLTPTVPILPAPLYLPLIVKNHPPRPTPTTTPSTTPSPTAPPTATATPAPRSLIGHDTCPGELLNGDWDLIAQDFDHSADQDWFAFDALSGVTYHIETLNLEANADTNLELYDLDCGNLITSSDDIQWPINLASRLIWTAPASGRYHIRIVPYDWSIYGPDTGYLLLIERSTF